MIADPCVAICSDRCAVFGDPPCYEVHADFRKQGKAVGGWKPCAECLEDANVEVPDALDPAAVIAPLL